ncbi:MAG TPA: peptidylprolyl isomerase [Thermoanaerobaculia bacterium]|nr:peptidylprolyl isomerase [Thermoanaerobaculia bacterium]
MLKVFRDNVKYLSWILWLVIGLFVLFVFVDWGTGYRSGKDPANWAAKVGGQTISTSEFQREYQAMESQLKQMYGEQFSPEAAKQMQLPLKALGKAVNTKVLLAEAQRIGLKASDDEVRETILADPSFLDKQGNFVGAQEYAQILQSNRFSVASFEQEVRNEIVLRKLSHALQAGLYVSDAEVERSYREQVEKAKIRYIEVPRSLFQVADQLKPSEVAAYFQAHHKEYKLPEEREAAYLLVEGNKLLDQVKLGDAELAAYYKEHQNDFKQDEQVRARHILLMVNDKRSDAEAKKQMDEVRKRIEHGADFGAVARELSEDPSSKPNGGDLGYFARGRMVKEFEDAAFASQPGQLVGPLKSPFGYHLLEVTGKRPGGVQPFAEVKEQIRSRLAFEKARQLAEAKAKELAQRLAAAKPKSAAELQALAKDQPGVSFASTGKFSQQEPVTGLGLAQPFNAKVFALKKGEVSEAIELPRGWAIAYLQEIHPAHPATLAEVEAKVRLALVTQKQQQLASERLTAARKEIEHGGKTLDQVARELGAPVKETAEFGAQGPIPGLGAIPQLVKEAMAKKTGELGGPVTDSRGAVLFQVSDRKSWEPAKFAAAREQTRQSLQQQKLGELLGALIERKKRELGVDYNRRLLEQFGISAEAAPPAPAAG